MKKILLITMVALIALFISFAWSNSDEDSYDPLINNENICTN